MVKLFLYINILFFLLFGISVYASDINNKKLNLKYDDWKIFCKLYPTKERLPNSTGIEGCSNTFKTTFQKYFSSNKNFKAFSATVNKKTGLIDGEHYGAAWEVINNQIRANVAAYDLCVEKNNFRLTDFYSDNQCALIAIGNKIVHKKTVIQFNSLPKNYLENDINDNKSIPLIKLPPKVPASN